MFHELEDQNLSLIQNGQDMEENIDEIKAQANVSLFLNTLENYIFIIL